MWECIIGLGNGLLPAWHQAITWTNRDLLIELYATNFIIQNFASEKYIWKCDQQNSAHFVYAEHVFQIMYHSSWLG